MMMAMIRLNVPSIFIYGGSILPGSYRGQPVTVQDLFEAVGKHSVGDMSDDDLDELETVACPSAGACGAQFTANTMATVSEAIGLALPYSAGAPAPYEIRDRFCMAAGEPDQGVIGMATDGQLHGIGDGFPGRQRRAHTLVAHGDAVCDGDGTELAGGAAGGRNALLDRLGLTHQGDVAGGGFIPARSDADERLVNLLGRQTHGVKVRPMRRARRPFRHMTAWQSGLDIGLGVH
jgi:hypothetical protein